MIPGSFIGIAHIVQGPTLVTRTPCKTVHNSFSFVSVLLIFGATHYAATQPRANVPLHRCHLLLENGMLLVLPFHHTSCTSKDNTRLSDVIGACTVLHATSCLDSGRGYCYVKLSIPTKSNSFGIVPLQKYWAPTGTEPFLLCNSSSVKACRVQF